MRHMFDEEEIKKIANESTILIETNLLYGEPDVQYDTIDGISLSGTSRLVYEGGKEQLPSSSLSIPIIPGNGISIDKIENENKVEIKTQLKTLFGNQSIYGSGNIDLFQHDIVMTKSNGKAFLTLYSSVNTPVDSLNDLKAITKNDTFTMSCTGYIGSKVVVAITELNLILSDGTTEILTNTTFQDTVTTI